MVAMKQIIRIETSHYVKSTLKQRCVCQRGNLQCRTTLKQRCASQHWTEQRWTTSKQRCEYDHFKKIYKHRFKNKIIFLNFKEYVGLNISLHFFPILTISWRRPLSYRNQFIDLLRKSIDWFLYDSGLRHERVRQV